MQRHVRSLSFDSLEGKFLLSDVVVAYAPTDPIADGPLVVEERPMEPPVDMQEMQKEADRMLFDTIRQMMRDERSTTREPVPFMGMPAPYVEPDPSYLQQFMDAMDSMVNAAMDAQVPIFSLTP